MTLASPFTPRPGERIHVLQVLGNAIVGGMESSVTRLVERLPRGRFSITALCPFESRVTEALRARGVDVLVAPITDDPSWSSIQMTCALIRANGIDVLHAHLPNAHVLAGVAGRLTGTPVLATIHGRQPSSLDIEVQRCTSTHMLVVSKLSYFHALGLGVAPSQLSCIPNGVDVQVFQPGRSAAAGLRQRFAVPAGAPLIGFAGRLSNEKGPEVFVRAALLLRSSLPEARLVLIGEGPMRAELAELIEHFDLTRRVHLAGLCDDMAAAYHELDVLVSSSHSEAMPLVLMEAMASGLPVVATRVGGVPDLVEQGETGWLVAPGDFQDIAGKLTRLLTQPGERERMGTRARERALAKFALDDCVQQTEKLLVQLTTPPVAPAEDAHAVLNLPAPTTLRHRGNGAGSPSRPTSAHESHA